MASLIEHDQPLNKRLTKHLLRRACFQYSKDQLNAMTGKTAAEILETLNVPKTFSWTWPNDPVTNYANSNCSGVQDGYWLSTPGWLNNKYPVGKQPKEAWLLAGGGTTP